MLIANEKTWEQGHAENVIDTGGRPLLDIASYARRGPGQRDHLSPAEVELIQRTVARAPEVMVKVLNRGAVTVKAVRAHFAYLNRAGELDIETDEGERLAGKAVAKRLLEDWDLDVEQHRRRADLRAGKDRAPPRLVHKLLFSMPPGTPPEKVLLTVKNFAREEFGLQHEIGFARSVNRPMKLIHEPEGVVDILSCYIIPLEVKVDCLLDHETEECAEPGKPGVRRSAFIIPAEVAKNRTKDPRPRLLVLNDAAQSIVESARGEHPRYVFTYEDHEGNRDRMYTLRSSGWVRARRRASKRCKDTKRVEAPAGFKSLRVHDLRHTFGRRLRATNVSLEDREDLLGHKSDRVTTDYSAPEIRNLIRAANQVIKSRNSPELTVLRVIQSHVSH